MNMFSKTAGVCAAALLSASALYGAANLIENPGFEQGTKGWEQMDSQSTIVPGEGRNGSAALRIARTDNTMARPIVKGHVQLETGRRYKIGGWVRTDGKLNVMDREGGSPLIGLEYWAKGKYGGWVAAGFGQGNFTDWRNIEVEYVAGDNEDASFVLLLMLSSGCYTGTIWYDDLYVEAIPGYWNFNMVYPMQNTFSTNGGTVRFFSHFLDIPQNEQRLDLTLFSGDKELWSKKNIASANYNFEVAMPEAAAGEYKLHAVLKDKAGKVLHKCDRRIFAAAPRDPNRGSRIDEKGNFIVDGKKFLPIGVYTGSLSHKTVDRFINCGFNFAITYNTVWLSTDDRDGGECNAQTVRETLDYCAEKGLKVGLSLALFDPLRSGTLNGYWGYADRIETITAIVKEFRTHPALACWYITDEPLPEHRPWVEKLSRMLAELDPDHVTFGCFNSIGTVPFYAGVSDIVSFDHYPIHSGAGDIQGGVSATKGMQSYGLPYWWIGQIMSWAAFKTEAGLRYPTDSEMLAQNLMAFINGAKGIVNFSAAYLVQKGDEALTGKRLADWRYMGTKSTVLSDYVLSDLSAPQCQVKNESGTLFQRTFANGKGEFVTLLVAPYAGDNKAVVTLPKGMTLVKSECGMVRETGHRTYEFAGKDCVCDILYLKKK